MGNDVSSTAKLAKHTAKATAMMSDAKKTVGLDVLDKKMSNVPKEPPTNWRERQKRHADREKEFKKRKEERERKKGSLMDTWNKNRTEIDSRSKASASARSTKTQINSPSSKGGSVSSEKKEDSNTAWWAN